MDTRTESAGDANIAAVASLLADSARATIMIALSDGRALPAGELARLAHVAPSTASSHLSKLVEGGLIEVEAWGRHRYYRVAGPEIVWAIEALSLVSPSKPVRSFKQSREAEAVRFARACYDHLAGFLGVKVTRSLVELGTLEELEDSYELTAEGLTHLREFGVSFPGREGRIRFAPAHIDWSERYRHFAGPLAKATTARLFELGWIARTPSSRVVRVTRDGRAGLRERFGLDLDEGLEPEAWGRNVSARKQNSSVDNSGLLLVEKMMPGDSLRQPRGSGA
jgi:DNA-binding transcriptional ArsR family regulator